jgi:hypothetical protein
METIARIRGRSIEASAAFSRVQSLRSPRYPISETIPAIAPGAAENPRFLVIVSKVKLGDRMVKLDPTTIEWFLVQLCLVQIRRMVDGAVR